MALLLGSTILEPESLSPTRASKLESLLGFLTKFLDIKCPPVFCHWTTCYHGTHVWWAEQWSPKIPNPQTCDYAVSWQRRLMLQMELRLTIPWPSNTEIILGYPDKSSVIARILHCGRRKQKCHCQHNIRVTKTWPATAGFEEGGRRLWVKEFR